MKLSIVVAVLDSHEIVRRQILHYQRIGLPDNAELVIVDDGSDPPLFHTVRPPGFSPSCSVVQVYDGSYQRNLFGSCGMSPNSRVLVTLLETQDKRPWTWALARNAGARIARGEYLLMTDIDYIIPRQALEDALAFTGDKMRFKREFGVLDENGDFTQDHEVLVQYGLSRERLAAKGTKMPPHPNNFVMRKDLFWDLGGYLEDRVGQPYPQREDGEFKRRWMDYVAAGKAKDSDYRPTIYMFPNGQFCASGDVDSDPMNLFHKLTRKTPHNPWYVRPRYG